MFESAQASCSIASCELKKFGCDENYDGDNLAIVDKGIHGVMNLKYGFKEKICYKCTDNNGDTVEKDGLTLLSKGESKEFVQNYPKVSTGPKWFTMVYNCPIWPNMIHNGP